MTNVSNMLYQVANGYRGTWEWSEGHNPAVLKFYKEAGHPEIKNDEVPWCAAFVGAVLAQCGLPNTGSLLARSYAGYGEEVSLVNARRGDIVVLQRGNSSWQGHVAFFDKLIGEQVYCLGGNQGDQVNIRPYRKEKIIAIRRAKEPKQALSESSTIKAASLGQIGAAAGPVVSAVAGMDWKSVLALAVLAVVLLGVFHYIKQERVSKFLNGAR